MLQDHEDRQEGRRQDVITPPPPPPETRTPPHPPTPQQMCQQTVQPRNMKNFPKLRARRPKRRPQITPAAAK